MVSTSVTQTGSREVSMYCIICRKH